MKMYRLTNDHVSTGNTTSTVEVIVCSGIFSVPDIIITKNVRLITCILRSITYILNKSELEICDSHSSDYVTVFWYFTSYSLVGTVHTKLHGITFHMNVTLSLVQKKSIR